MSVLTKNIFGALLISASLIGCENPPKKESDQSIFNELLQDLNQHEVSLKEVNVELDSEELFQQVQKSDFTASKRVQQIQKLSEPKLEEIKTRLERYSESSHKLFQLADSKVVVLPEKENLLRKHKISAYYLASIYSNIDWTGHYTQLKFAEVDWIEFNIRFKRTNTGLNRLEALGFPNGTKDDMTFPEAKPANHKKYKEAQQIYVRLYTDNLRSKLLSERNKGFGYAGIEKMAASFEALAGYYYTMSAATSQALAE